MAVKVMEPYRNLSREELLNKVYEFGCPIPGSRFSRRSSKSSMLECRRHRLAAYGDVWRTSRWYYGAGLLFWPPH